jgi:hypothetical protein
LAPVSEEEMTPNLVCLPDALGKPCESSCIYPNFEKGPTDPIIHYETVSRSTRKFSQHLFSPEPLHIYLPPLQSCNDAGHYSQTTNYPFPGYTLPSLKSLFSN